MTEERQKAYIAYMRMSNTATDKIPANFFELVRPSLDPLPGAYLKVARIRNSVDTTDS